MSRVHFCWWSCWRGWVFLLVFIRMTKMEKEWKQKPPYSILSIHLPVYIWSIVLTVTWVFSCLLRARWPETTLYMFRIINRKFHYFIFKVWEIIFKIKKFNRSLVDLWIFKRKCSKTIILVIRKRSRYFWICIIRLDVSKSC